MTILYHTLAIIHNLNPCFFYLNYLLYSKTLGDSILDKLIKKDKQKIDKMMNTLIEKDIPRDKKIHKCDKMMKKGKK